MTTFRSRTTALATVSTAALVLTLTACNGDGGAAGGGGSAATKAAAPAAAPAASQAQPAQGGGASQGAGASQGTGTGSSAGAGAGSGAGAAQPAATKAPAPTAAASTPLCTVKDVAISAAHQDGPPYTHIVLTAKNTSGHSCRLDDHPQIRFLESHRENVPAVAKSKPAAPVVLTAGAPAYALVKLSDGGVHENNEPVTAFSVALSGSSGQATVKAPGAEGIAVDPAAWATGYWTYELRNGADEF
ncbi:MULTISPECIES: DUF4232 domain-containing protein [unclassified Kitasatospora]|uniref:DUF4232 domain-containing protein n=1 Tax=unclassified Kitasatospora TaxID=2633591 RepID=UPI002F914CDE